MSGQTIAVGAGDLPVWPDSQEITALDDERTVLRTRFTDTEAYHPALSATILEMAARPAFAGQRARSMGGTKLYGLHDWDSPAAELVEARAVELFRRALDSERAAVDLSWANVYGCGDYIMPHSHIRTVARLVVRSRSP